MPDSIESTRKAAEGRGLAFTDCGRGHVQIRAPGVVVNYWPESRRQTAYCPEINKRVPHARPKDACALALEASQGVPASEAPAKPAGKKKAKAKRRDSPYESNPEPRRTNPAGLRHFYEGETPPWDEALGEFRFESESDRLRYLAWQLEEQAIQHRAEAEIIDEPEPTRATSPAPF